MINEPSPEPKKIESNEGLPSDLKIRIDYFTISIERFHDKLRRIQDEITNYHLTGDSRIRNRAETNTKSLIEGTFDDRLDSIGSGLFKLPEDQQAQFEDVFWLGLLLRNELVDRLNDKKAFDIDSKIDSMKLFSYDFKNSFGSRVEAIITGKGGLSERERAKVQALQSARAEQDQGREAQREKLISQFEESKSRYEVLMEKYGFSDEADEDIERADKSMEEALNTKYYVEDRLELVRLEVFSMNRRNGRVRGIERKLKEGHPESEDVLLRVASLGELDLKLDNLIAQRKSDLAA